MFILDKAFNVTQDEADRISQLSVQDREVLVGWQVRE